MYEYRVSNFRVVDGDTVDCDIDLGFGVTLSKQRIRLDGVDTPEKRTRDPIEKAAGELATKYVTDWFKGPGDVTLLSREFNPTGKFGRILGDFIREDKLYPLGESLINERLGVAYTGQNKEVIWDLHEANFNYLQDKGLI